VLASLRSTRQCRLVPKVGDHHRVPGVLLLPRVHCLGAFENAQALALHRFHAQRSLGASERLARGTVWTKSWKSQYVAFHCRGAASTGYDLLSRLCRRTPRICAHRPLWASKFCASITSKFCSLLEYSSNLLSWLLD